MFLTYHFPPEVGGIQTRIAGYLTELSRRGIRSTVLVVGSSREASRTHEGAEPATIIPARNVKLVKCKGGARGLLPGAANVLTVVGSGRADVVHVFTGAATLLGVFTLLMGRVFGRPSAMSVFGREDISQRSRIQNALFVLACTLATTISTNSASTGRLLPNRFRGKTRVLLGGSSAPTSTPHSGARSKSILYVGRLVRRKGLDDLLGAFAITKSSVPEANLVIVGNGPEREVLEKTAKDLGIEDSVRFEGTLLGQPLSSAYDSCAVCVLPSKDVADDTATEGLGLALVEAAIHGKPLVGTDHGGISEVIRDGVNGFLVPQGDPKRLSNALVRLLGDGDLARRMGAEALRIAKSKFTLEAATDRLLESYAERVPR